MPGTDTYCELIETNLYDFYFTLAETNGLTHTKNNPPFFVNSGSGRWPSYILGDIPSGDQVAYIRDLSDMISRGMLPAFWIMREPPDPEPILALLSESGIRPVTRWTGMMLIPDDYRPPEPSAEETEIRVTDRRSGLTEWTELVNREILMRERVERDLFNRLSEHPSFSFYSALVEGKAVATALAFTHRGVTGLYLISTDSSFRRKGIGRAITSFAIEDCFRRNSECIVLHATRAGYSVYSKAGFREYCFFDILWMLGK